MNIYQTEFFAKCPINKIRIHYRLRIETEKIIPVEELMSRIETVYAEGFHELMADDMHERFGGRQVLKAHHHGVDIETIRGSVQ
jgi:hypothetical protein